MIDLKRGLPYERSKQAQKFLTDARIWLETFAGNQSLQKEILDWIRKDQLTDTGEDSTGEVIGFYSHSTARRNPSKAFNTPYTLDDTGSLYRSMFMDVLRDSLEIDATDTAKLQDQEWWRENIIALSDESLTKLIDVYKESIISYGKKILSGSI